jgi:hypothetical protein
MGHGYDATPSTYRPQRIGKQTLQGRISGAPSYQQRTDASHQNASLFDHLVDAHEERHWHLKAESPCSLEVDH